MTRDWSLKKITDNVLELIILNGKFLGEVFLPPRIPIIPLDSPIPLKHLQFSTIRLASAKFKQFQSVDLEKPRFLLGQLYAVCSRFIGKPSSLFVYTPHGLTKHIVRTLV